MKLLVAIDGVSDADRELPGMLKRLATETRKPAGEWERALAAPGLGRVLFSVTSEQDARTAAAPLAAAGLVPHLVTADDVGPALDQAFEAVWAEPSRQDLLVIGPAGQELDVAAGAIRLVATGRQQRDGAVERFVVLGLRDSVGAVILRFPGADVSKIAGEAQGDEAVDAFLAFLARIAPHARVERGLERHSGKLPGLGELGTSDLAHAAVVAAWLLRRFPPQPKPAQAPQADAHAAPAQAADVQRAPHARLPDVPSAPGGRTAWTPLPPTPDELRRRKRNRLVAAGAAVVIALVVAYAVLHKPAESVRIVKLHETWASPYGVTFTFDASYDAGIDDVPDVGFVVVAKKGDASQTFRVPHRDASTVRDAFGVPWHITTADDGAHWITIDTKRP